MTKIDKLEARRRRSKRNKITIDQLSYFTGTQIQKKEKTMDLSSIFVAISSLCFLFGLNLIIKLFRKLWFNPIRIKRIMQSQGIHGPSYKFIHGNVREMHSRRLETLAKPMELSHHILPRVMPHTHFWLHKYGKTFLQWFGVDAQLVLTDPDMIKEVLLDREKNFPKVKLSGFVQKIFGNGLFTAEGERWVKFRKIANFAFHGDSLKNMIPTMIECAEIMVEGWKDQQGKELDVFEELKVFTSDVISHTAFGSSYLEGKNIFQMLQKIAMLFTRNGFRSRLPIIRKIFETKDDIEGDQLEKRIGDLFTEIIKTREAKFVSGEADNYGNDFLGLLVKAKNDPEKSKRISVDDIVDECKTFYFAGHETTNVLIAWTIFLLSLNKDWQEEAREEVLRIFGHKNPTSEGLPKLKKMTMIINECLRLYPPAMPVPRQVKKEVRLGNLLLPTTLQLTIPTIAVHHNSAVWGEDAHVFKPERFSEGIVKATENNPAAYIPFGLGPRTCVGMNFAMNEAKIAMSMILQRYSFILSPSYTHSPVQFITMCPEHGLHIVPHSISDQKA